MSRMTSKRLLFTIKAFLGFIFLVVVLGSSVLSKLTLVSLTDKLRNVSYYPNTTRKTSISSTEDRNAAVMIYWYLQLILLIPNFITFVRCLAFGVIGKTTKTFPWPKGWSVLIVSVEHTKLTLTLVGMGMCGFLTCRLSSFKAGAKIIVDAVLGAYPQYIIFLGLQCGDVHSQTLSVTKQLGWQLCIQENQIDSKGYY